MDGDGGRNGILLRVDHTDGAVAGVDHVDLVASEADGDSGGVLADGEFAVAPQIHDIEDGDGIASAVGDIGKFAIVGGILREIMMPARRGQQKRDRSEACNEDR